MNLDALAEVRQTRSMRILLIEDEARLANLIRRVLVGERHVVDVAPDGVAGVALAERSPHDVIVLDRGLPDIDGLSVLRLLRGRKIETPVLILTALGSVEERVVGLEAGADDYLPKPFAFAELIARIKALARRPPESAEARVTVGLLELDELRHVARAGERTVELSAREFAFLSYLMRHAGQVVTRQQILDAVWGAEPDLYSNVVDLYIHYLRRKLRDLGEDSRLRTVRGVGYSLRADS